MTAANRPSKHLTFLLTTIVATTILLSGTSPMTKSRNALLEAHIFVVLLKIADTLNLQAEHLIKSSGLTSAQYNTLRILRGAEPAGLACRGIAERMISHDSDITRLLDRMEKHDLIIRERQTDDRRVVKTRITKKGLDILKTLDQPVRDLHKRQFRHVPATKLKQLAELLQELQAPGEE
jgi:DNA-binding MarR family transcriptional regulator